jgi:hypothetical protein
VKNNVRVVGEIEGNFELVIEKSGDVSVQTVRLKEAVIFPRKFLNAKRGCRVLKLGKVLICKLGVLDKAHRIRVVIYGHRTGRHCARILQSYKMEYRILYLGHEPDYKFI